MRPRETLPRGRRLLVIVYPGGKQQQRIERGRAVGFERGTVGGKQRFIVLGEQRREQQFVRTVGVVRIGKQREQCGEFVLQ